MADAYGSGPGGFDPRDHDPAAFERPESPWPGSVSGYTDPFSPFSPEAAARIAASERAAAQWARDLARYGLTPQDVLDWGMQGIEKLGTNATLNALGGGFQAKEFGRNFVTGSFGLPAMTGALTPQDIAIAKGLQAGMGFLGTPGVVLGRAMRATLGSIPGGHGGGQGFPDVDPRGMEGIAGPSPPRTVAPTLYAQAPGGTMTDASPYLGLPGVAPDTIGAPVGPTLGQPDSLWTPDMPPWNAPQGLPLPPGATGAAPPTVAPALPPPPVAPSPAAGPVDETTAARKWAIDQLTAEGVKPSTIQKVLQVLALGVAGAGDVARNLQRDPKTGLPLYAPSAQNMQAVLATMAKGGAGGGEGGGGTARAKAVLDATNDDRTYLQKLAESARTATKESAAMADQLLGQAAKFSEEAEGASPERQAQLKAVWDANADKAQAPHLKDYWVPGSKTTMDLAGLAGDLAPFLNDTSPQEKTVFLGSIASMAKKEPEKAREMLETWLVMKGGTDVMPRAKAAAEYIRKTAAAKGAPIPKGEEIPTEDVRDLVVSQAGDKAQGFERILTGSIGTDAAKAQINSFLKENGIAPIGAKGEAAKRTAESKSRLEEKKAAIPLEAEQAVATGTAMTPVEAAKQAAIERATAPARLEYAENIKKLEAKYKDKADGKEKITLADESRLRKEFEAHSTKFLAVQDAFGRIQQVVKTPSAVGDVTLLVSYAKMLDPESVVREGEVDVLRKTGAIPDALYKLYTTMLGGKATLSPAQRADFFGQAQGIFQQSAQNMQGYEQEYTRLATESGIPASRIVVKHPRLGGATHRFNPATGKIEPK